MGYSIHNFIKKVRLRIIYIYIYKYTNWKILPYAYWLCRNHLSHMFDMFDNVAADEQHK